MSERIHRVLPAIAPQTTASVRLEPILDATRVCRSESCNVFGVHTLGYCNAIERADKTSKEIPCPSTRR